MRKKFNSKFIFMFLLISLALFFSGGCGGGGSGGGGGNNGESDGNNGGNTDSGDLQQDELKGTPIAFYIQGDVNPKKFYPDKNGVITIDPGKYRIVHDRTLSDVYDPHILIKNRKKITIIAKDVEFIFTEVRDGLKFDNCSDVLLDGLTLSYSVPFHTQGEITSVGDDSVEFKVDIGYPNLNELPGKKYMGVVWDKNLGRQKEGTRHLHDDRELADSNSLTGVDKTTNIVTGDTIVVRNIDIDPRTLISVGSDKMVIQNVTVLDGGAAFMEDTGKGGHRYVNCKVEVGSKPVGATAERILSTAADAFHSICMESGPSIENCKFYNMGDDGVNIHGMYVEALTVNADKIIVIAVHDNWRIPFYEGDTIKAYDSSSKKFVEAGIVMTPIKLLGKGSENPTKVEPTAHCFKQSNSSFGYFELTLSQADGVKSGYLLYSPDRIGAGFNIKNTLVRNNLARGFLIKSQNGTIDGCEIDGCGMYGLQFDAELNTAWAEAFIPRDVAVTGTVINNTGNRVGYDVPDGVFISPEAINNNISVTP